MNAAAPPSPEELAAELRPVIAQHGLRVAALLKRRLLLALETVRAQAASDAEHDRAVAFRSVLGQAIARLGDSPSGQAARHLFSLSPSSRGQPLKVKRRLAADELGISPETFRTGPREGELVEEVAEALYALESEYRMRQAHRLLASKRPTESGLAINWLELHQAYALLWTIVYAIQADLLALLHKRREHPDHPTIAKDERSSLWHFARFLLERERFIKRFGGLWLLADPEAEIQVADAVYLIGFHAPFSQEDDSWLRVALAESADEELVPFLARLDDGDPTGRRLLEEWREWTLSCRCDLDDPEEGCEVHQVIAACNTYTKLVDEDWVAIADWYRDTSNVNIHGLDLEDLFRRFWKPERR